MLEIYFLYIYLYKQKKSAKNNTNIIDDSLIIIQNAQSSKKRIYCILFFCIKKSKSNHITNPQNRFPKLSDNARLAIAIIKGEDDSSKVYNNAISLTILRLS